MLLGGPLDDLEARRGSRQVLDAFATFFAAGDPSGLQAELIATLAEVAARYADDPAVVGFEIFNEPVATPDQLLPFHQAAAAALRAAAPDKLVFFEPPAVRNFTDFEPLAAAPFPQEGAVYATHGYTFVFGGQDDRLAAMTEDDLRVGVDNARAEADAWGVPLVVDEFGIGPTTTRADDWMRWEAELHDEYLASDAFWVWKERSQGSWGLFDHDDATDTWTERPQVVGWVSRLHLARIAARDARLDSSGGRILLEPIDPLDAPHLLYVPEALAGALSLTCDGAPADAGPRDPATGLVEVGCAGELIAAPGA
jgi:endoglycosylceramidase